MSASTFEILASDANFIATIDADNRFVMLFKGQRFDVDNGYVNLDGGRDMRADVRRTLETTLLPEARAAYDKMVALRASAAVTGAETPREAVIEQTVVTDAAVGNVADTTPVTGLKDTILDAFAEATVDKVTQGMKPVLDQFIKDTYGVLPKLVEVKVGDTVRKVTGLTHERFSTVCSFVASDVPVFLTGAAGTGKNYLMKQVAEALSLNFYFANAVTDIYTLLGFIDANGTFHETEFFRAFVNGGLFMLDEADASIPEVLVLLNAAIANRYMVFPTGRFEAHPDFRVVDAGNTFGTGADMEYTGRFQLDAATLDRFALVDVDYCAEVEAGLCGNDADIMEFLRGLRKACANVGVKHVVSYRAFERMSTMKSALKPAELVQFCVTKHLSKDDRKVLHSDMLNSGRVSESNPYLKALKSL